MKLRQILFASWLGLMCWGGLAWAESKVFAIEADDLTGQSISLESYQGKALVLNFWATWCPPCVKEMPELEALSQAHPDVQFVGLAIDTQRNVKRFLEKVPVNYAIYVTGHRGVQIMKTLGNKAGGIPFTLVLNADGSVAQQVLGQIDSAQLDQILTKLKN
ncbi:TlpA family protein disulfide reductase [Paenalcaligenes hominis]|uniref:TlpA family protein disulfide reductase n=1 Tax=Paenalcaligenes hominis TaxID=643674 RepID=UPI00352443A2